MTVTLLPGDALEVLRSLPGCSVQMICCSPPYYGLRDYGVPGQIGHEPTSDAYVDALVTVFREARRVLKDDGVCWCNLGDCYSGAKQLQFIPTRVALALQADGWWARSDVIWNKPNPMPESAVDRPTSAHEHVFLLSKSATYFYDADAVKQPLAEASYARLAQDVLGQDGSVRANGGTRASRPMKAVRFGGAKGAGKHGSAGRRSSGKMWDPGSDLANLRNVWTIPTQNYKGAHFAVMPPLLAELCVLAGSRVGDTVLDPFAGAGTTGLVADRLQRHAILIDINPANVAESRERILADAGMFADLEAGYRQSSTSLHEVEDRAP